METDGELVYRIHKKLIDAYVEIFLEAEENWTNALVRHTRLDCDYGYVSSLDEENRLLFWLDKFCLYKDTFLRTFLVLLELTYCSHGCWRKPFFCWKREEQELMFVVYLHLKANPDERFHLRKLSRHLFWQFNFIDV